jgi:D-amino peptidase
MKIFISADIEGVTDVTHWDETHLQEEESRQFREQMTAEVVAACEGALEAGAQEIWVKDAHGSGRNIFPAKLPHEVRLIRGWSSHPLMMVQELDESFQGLAFIGYHSRAGASSSPLSHTISGKYAEIRINNQPASEFLIHAYAAAFHKVPSFFVSGDKGICDEASQLIPMIKTVAVKEGIGDSTINIHPELATSYIRTGVERSIKNNLDKCQLPLPDHFDVKIQYKEHKNAFMLGFYPGARQINDTTVEFKSKSYFEALRFFLFAP